MDRATLEQLLREAESLLHRGERNIAHQREVIGTLVGSMMIGLINNGLLLYNLQDYQQDIVRGVIIILAVALAGRD